ncbi:alpha/beta fold hydrolase [Changchengzhania lutea]|uniref:alpha/beta fold hydrolase n=1 Tax=Changchengzhania lutea TaxID=2049305 RepID=UPI00115EC6B3|nr:alpha/beta fold hydrolase [Changchengzhania lutea]
MSKKNILYSNIIGEGKPLVVLHGFLGSSDNWKTLGKQFNEQGFLQVHLVDQRNHGRSFWDDQFNYTFLAQDLKAYCEFHNLSEIILIGHSMGGKTAMLFATLFPEMVSKLIIADISPRYYPTHHDAILAGLSAINFEAVKSRGEADTILSDYVSDFGIRQFLLKNLYWIEKGKLALRINLEVLKRQVESIGEALPEDAKFTENTLFIKGAKSDYIKSDDEVLIKKHFPNATIETIKNAGHWLHAENPKDFYNIVMQFIN